MQFNFDLGEKKLTTQDILNKVSEESLFKYYTQEEVDNKLHTSKLRQDNNPTCGYFRGNSGRLYIKDFATGSSFDIFAYIQRLYSCSFAKAIRIIANDFNISSSTVTSKRITITPTFKSETTKIQVEIQPFKDYELEWWNSFGITEKLLRKYNVFSCKHVFLNGRVISTSSKNCPIYGYYGGKKDNLEQWRIYYPFRSHKNGFRFLSNWKADKIQGFKQLPKDGKLLIITKSLKDVMALRAYGIPAIAPVSEVLFISDKVLSALKNRFKYIIAYYDRDKAGMSNLWKIRKAHPELEYFVNPPNTAKDFTDFRKKYGNEETKKAILEVIAMFKAKWEKRL